MRFKVLVFLILISAVFLSSCSFGTPNNTDADGDSGESKQAEDIAENRELPDELLKIDGINGIVLDDGIKYHEFNGGKAVVVYNDKNAWVFDLKLNKIIPLIDFDAMYKVADVTGRGEKYFDRDLSISLECKEGINYTFANILIKVKGEMDSEYSVYTTYYAEDFGNIKGGTLGEYNHNSIIYPKFDLPITIYDINDYESLYISEEMAKSHTLYKWARAIVENDVPTLSEICNLVSKSDMSEILSSWEGMEISEYSITRKAPFTYLDELGLNLKIEKSNVEALPAGKYSVQLVEGIGMYAKFTNLDEPEADIESEALDFAMPWISSYGDIEKCEPQNGTYVHAILDSTGWYYGGEAPMSFDQFVEYCEEVFGLYDVDKYYDEEFVTGHGAHGGRNVYYKVRNVLTASGVCQITVDYFADPMYSVVAKTYKFEVHGDSGHYIFGNRQVIYDSGYPVCGYTV